MVTLWETAPCTLVEVDGRFRGAYCLLYLGDGRQYAPQTSVYFNEIIRRCVLLRTRLRVDLKYQTRNVRYYRSVILTKPRAVLFQYFISLDKS
jgi:hypothetical protein